MAPAMPAQGSLRNTAKVEWVKEYPSQACGNARGLSVVCSYILPSRISAYATAHSILPPMIRLSSSEIGSSNRSAYSIPVGHASVLSAISLGAIATALSLTVDSNASNRVISGYSSRASSVSSENSLCKRPQ